MTDVVKIVHNNTHAEKGSDNVMSVFWCLASERRQRASWWEFGHSVLVARFVEKAVYGPRVLAGP